MRAGYGSNCCLNRDSTDTLISVALCLCEGLLNLFKKKAKACFICAYTCVYTHVPGCICGNCRTIDLEGSVFSFHCVGPRD